MNPRIEQLVEKARQLPKAPGVYLMKDTDATVIYIGKSASLRDRVGSYFQPSTRLEHKKAGLVDQIHDFDTIQTDSEVEALLVENRLIKDIQPRYNARLLDDKTFPYLMVTTGDDFPGVFVTRQPKTTDVRLFGPFTGVGQLKEAVTLFQKAFKFRTCELDIRHDDAKRKYFRPCLLYAIKQCSGPCADKISKEAYAADVQRFLKFLEGGKKTIIAQLERDMLEASKSMQFEKAARLRDEVRALSALGLRGDKSDQQFWQPEAFVTNPKEGVEALQDILGLTAAPRIVEAIDIAHLQGGEMVGSKSCFIDGVPFKDFYRRYKIKHGQGNNDFLSIQEVVGRRYREAGAGQELFPDVILIDGGIGQLHAALDVFKGMDAKPPMVISLAKKEELIYVQNESQPLRLPRNHAGLRLLQYVRDEAHRFAQHYHHVLRRKAQLEGDPAESARRIPRRGGKRSLPLEQLPPEAPSPLAPDGSDKAHGGVQ
jgi:excinuclease ABC subunit C